MANSTVQFNPHSPIFKEGDEATKIYIISSGEVLCLKNSKGKLIPVFKAGKGDVLGESSMVKGAPYTYSAVSLTNVQMIEMEASDMHEVLKLSPTWLSNLTMTMITRFNNTANLVAANRILHESIMSEEEFTPSREMEYKKLLS